MDKVSWIAWAAGVFEGEGTITRSANRQNGSATLTLQLGMTDEDVVDRFAAVVGVGNVGGPYGPYSDGRKPFWKWYVHGENAHVLLGLFWPYLGSRRRQRASELIDTCSVSHRLTAADYIAKECS